MIGEESYDPKGNRTFSVVTAPTVEPATAAELKTFARLDVSSEDSFLEDLIKAAREASEFYTNRAFLEQIIRLRLDFWPEDADHIELPRPPIVSFTKFVTVDEADSETAYSASNYYLITDCEPAKLVIAYGCTPPTNENRTRGGIMMEYKAGHGSQASYVPSMLRLAVQMWATIAYEQRVFDMSKPPEEVKKLLDPYRIFDA